MHFHIKDKTIFLSVLLITALFISLTGASFSIYGITALFAGASIYVALMAGSLEIGKIVAVTYLFQFWKQSSKMLKVYLFCAIVILMVITSLGIFAFLSAAFQKTASGVDTHEAEIEMLKTQKIVLIAENNRTKERINYLQDLRNKQENRLDKAFEDRRGTRNLNSDIKNTAQETKELNSKIDFNNIKLDSIEIKILKMNNQLTSGDIGPFYYISVMFNTDINTVAKWFIIILIIVFDPLAIALLIAANTVIRLRKSEQLNKEVTEESYKLFTEDEMTKDLGHIDNVRKHDPKPEAKPIELEIVTNEQLNSMLKNKMSNIKKKQNTNNNVVENKKDTIKEENLYKIPEDQHDIEVKLSNEKKLKHDSENIKTFDIRDNVVQDNINDINDEVPDFPETDKTIEHEFNNIDNSYYDDYNYDEDIDSELNSTNNYIYDVENNDNLIKDQIENDLNKLENQLPDYPSKGNEIDINKYIDEIMNKNNINRQLGNWHSNNFPNK